MAEVGGWPQVNELPQFYQKPGQENNVHRSTQNRKIALFFFFFSSSFFIVFDHLTVV